jgi:hypothetical protein
MPPLRGWRILHMMHFALGVLAFSHYITFCGAKPARFRAATVFGTWYPGALALDMMDSKKLCF